jgi:putative membrane protein
MAVLPVACALAITLGCNRTENAPSATEESLPAGTFGTVEEVRNNQRQFLTKAMDGNMTEVELGRMAQNQAASPEVKAFAAMMVADHSNALDALKPIANRQGTPMVAQLDEEHRELRDKLAQLRGAEFDREYMRAMVDGHEKMVDLLQLRANEDRFGDDKGAVTPEKTNDPMAMEINAWAAKALPTTRHHLEEAKRINDSLGDRQTSR